MAGCYIFHLVVDQPEPLRRTATRAAPSSAVVPSIPAWYEAAVLAGRTPESFQQIGARVDASA